MSPRTVDRVDDWETVPFGGGYDGLRDLASQEFSGVVTAGPTRLFMIRGTVVGVLDGSIADFEDAGGDAREAPHPALPLLAVMQERSDEVRAQYYTEDTPLSDVDRTLEDGGFTGYVELSENVLSGDYYQVYHQGRSMSVAYVGSSSRLITDDDAFEQANDEVGIYEVRPVDIDPIDIPDPTDDAAESTAVTESDDAGSVGDDAGSIGTDSDTRETASEDLSGIGLGDDGPSSTESDAAESVGAADPSEPDEDIGRSGEASAESTDDTSMAETPTDDSSTTDTSTTDVSPTGSVDFGPAAERTAPDSEPRQTGTDSHSEPDSSDNHAGRSVSERTHDETPDDDTPDSPRDPPSPSTPTSTPETAVDEQSAESREQPQRSKNQPQSTPSKGTEQRQPDTTASGADDQPPTGDRHPTGTGTDPQESDQRPSSSASADTAADLEVRSIPSLDPSLTEAVDTMGASEQAGRDSNRSAQSSGSQRSQQGQQPSHQSQEQVSTEQSTQQPPTQQSPQSPPQQQASTADQSPSAGADQQTDAEETTESPSGFSEEVSRLESELRSREQRIEDLRTDLERVEAERDELETARADLESERDRLQTELEESRAEIERLTERLEEASEGDTDADQTQISPGEAIDNTNLFVRYRSKGDATLETAHTGDADQSAVAENLRLEYHTQFDAEAAVVGTESFDDYLTETIQYRFVDWLIGSLLYEIRDTGHTDGMADLYNALPKIDRAELNGQVSVNYTEDGEEHRSQERFDVVVRDRMGNPLVVANINDSRDPATDSMMTDLIKRAERVGESGETLAGAFLVTESFFEPGALETAEEATSSGLFSRDKRKSFVNLSRKGGYHLCLVEARNQEFHLAVPEL